MSSWSTLGAVITHAWGSDEQKMVALSPAPPGVGTHRGAGTLPGGYCATRMGPRPPDAPVAMLLVRYWVATEHIATVPE
jgi:hypothetical protein